MLRISQIYQKPVKMLPEMIFELKQESKAYQDHAKFMFDLSQNENISDKERRMYALAACESYSLARHYLFMII